MNVTIIFQGKYKLKHRNDFLNSVIYVQVKEIEKLELIARCN